ncbi:MAG: branched-chain amino acid ABC transporter permease [Betaproteobacteria bacterium]|nr:branched-chain amino acid ABC transporter permease [Betaproteobacteria bacterium]
MSRPTQLVIALALLALALPAALPWLKTPFILGTAFGIAALGISILIVSGQISFGHAMFMCSGGYAVAFAARQWPQLDSAVLLLMGAGTGLLLGVVVGSFVVRYRAIFFGMLNLALSMVLYAVLGKFFHITGGTDGLRLERAPFFGMSLDRDTFETVLLLLSVLLALITGWLVRRYQRSVAGQALAAIKTNETRLEYVGISAYKALWIGYIFSATVCGLSGAIFAIAQGLVTPEMGYWVRSGEIIFVAILGGVGHPVGAFIGAGIFEFVKLFAAAYLTGAWQLVLGCVLIAIVFLAPRGVSALLDADPDKTRGQS